MDSADNEVNRKQISFDEKIIEGKPGTISPLQQILPSKSILSSIQHIGKLSD